MTYPTPPPHKPQPDPGCVCGLYERGRYACTPCWLIVTGEPVD